MAAVKRGRWWKGPLVAVASAVVMLLTIEAGHRVWLAAAGTPYDAEATAQEIEGVAALLQGELPVPEDAPPASSPIAGEKDIVHPYFGIDFSARVKELTTDAAYFAGPESAENLDVVLLGGSVAAIFGDLGAAPLRFVLEGDPRLRGKRLRISNQGRGGFKQPQQALVLAFVLGLGWKPDVVVNLDGFNEVALTMENASYEVFPGYPVATEWGPVVFKDADNAALTALRAAAERRRAESGRFAASVKAWRLERCSILGTFALARLRRWAFERAADTQRYLRITFEGKRTVERQGPAFDASDGARSGSRPTKRGTARGRRRTSRECRAAIRGCVKRASASNPRGSRSSTSPWPSNRSPSPSTSTCVITIFSGTGSSPKQSAARSSKP
jgi:hypothetical protein